MVDMGRFLSLIFILAGCGVEADEALQFFTNQANAALQVQFAFSTANIPIYSPGDPTVRYSAAIHYVLQAAANAYDATTPATNYPSVFRPQFGWQGSNLFIVGYTNVTTDFDAQFAVGFKDITDATIGPNDNVWGVPWVVGTKDYVPQFNEFSCDNVITRARKLEVVRPSASYALPVRTNQLSYFALSNVIGFATWNGGPPLPGPVEVIAFDRISVVLTNNYNWGTNFVAFCATNFIVTNWQGARGGDGIPITFVAAMLTNLISLPSSQWIETAPGMIPTGQAPPASEFNQPGLPSHDWLLYVTNNFFYALVDRASASGHVIDCVNFARLGDWLDWNQIATNQPPPFPGGSLPPSSALVWQTAGGTDFPTSPVSAGVSNQMMIGLGLIQVYDWYWRFYQPSINAFSKFVGGYPALTNVMDCPMEALTTIDALSDYRASNPRVHFTLDDFTNLNLLGIFPQFGTMPTPPRHDASMDAFAIDPTPPWLVFGVSTNQFTMDFQGVADLPYMIWSSPNLSDWTQLGTAAQPAPGEFEFLDATTNAAARFYQIRVP